MTRVLLLVGTPRARSSSRATPTGATGPCAARCARAGRSTTSSSSPAAARSWPAAARRGTARRSGGARTSARPGRTLGRADLRRRRRRPRADRRPSGAWPTTPDGAILAGVEPAGLFRSDDGGRDLVARRGPDRTTRPAPTWEPGAGGLILHTIVPHPTDPQRTWVGISAVGVFETRDGGATLGAAQPRRPRRLQPRPVPGHRPVRPQVRAGGRRARDALPAEPLRGVPLDGRRRDLDGGHRTTACRASSGSRWSPTRATRRRSGSSRSTATTAGRFVPDAPAAVWRTSDRGDTWTASRRRACPSTTPTCRCCARRWPATRSTRSGSRSGRRPASSGTAATRASSWRRITADLPEIWAVEAVVLD